MRCSHGLPEAVVAPEVRVDVCSKTAENITRLVKDIIKHKSVL